MCLRTHSCCLRNIFKDNAAARASSMVKSSMDNCRAAFTSRCFLFISRLSAFVESRAACLATRLWSLSAWIRCSTVRRSAWQANDQLEFSFCLPPCCLKWIVILRSAVHGNCGWFMYCGVIDGEGKQAICLFLELGSHQAVLQGHMLNSLVESPLYSTTDLHWLGSPTFGAGEGT